MADIVDRSTRSRMMSGIGGSNTKPETRLRKALHAAGLRYRLHVGKLPGRPDVVFPKFRAVVFVHGCFWHRHGGCRLTTMPATNKDFWQEKFDGNVLRDARNIAALKATGWRVAVVWECSLRGKSIDAVADAVGGWLRSDELTLELPAAARASGSGMAQ